MTYEERLEYIKKLQNKTSFRGKRSPASIILNFYTFITIVIVSVVIVFYSKYILPPYEAKKQEELKQKQHQEYLELRRKQIELSHKLNSQESLKKEDQNVSKETP